MRRPSRDLPARSSKKPNIPAVRFICVLVEVDIEPNGVVPRHTHPGVESSYLVSGGCTFSVEGQPDRVLKAGDGFQVPPEVPHSVRNGPRSVTGRRHVHRRERQAALLARAGVTPSSRTGVELDNRGTREYRLAGCWREKRRDDDE